MAAAAITFLGAAVVNIRVNLLLQTQPGPIRPSDTALYWCSSGLTAGMAGVIGFNHAVGLGVTAGTLSTAPLIVGAIVPAAGVIGVAYLFKPR